MQGISEIWVWLGLKTGVSRAPLPHLRPYIHTQPGGRYSSSQGKVMQLGSTLGYFAVNRRIRKKTFS